MHRKMLRRTCSVAAMEIKPREIAFSVAIVFVMVALGFLLGSKISDHIAETNEKFTTATQITDDQQFQYALDTDFGNVIAYGNLVAEQPVSADDLDGEYAQLTKITERYTMHTREVTYTDSKGHTHTRTEIYWTWDEIDREKDSTETYMFMGASFPADKFSVTAHQQGDTIYDSRFVRHYYEAVDANMVGSIHTQIKDHMIADNNRFYTDAEPQAIVNLAIRRGNIAIILFGVLWIALTGGAVYGFCALENRWLDG